MEKQRIEKCKLDKEILEKKERLDEMTVCLGHTQKEAHELDRRMYELQQYLTKETKRSQ